MEPMQKLEDLKKKLPDLKAKSKTSGLMRLEMNLPKPSKLLKIFTEDLMLLKEKLLPKKLRLRV